MTFEEAKKEIETHYNATVEETEDEIVVHQGDSKIAFNKKTHYFTALGYGSELSFTTYPIYEPWRKLIKVWLGETE